MLQKLKLWMLKRNKDRNIFYPDGKGVIDLPNGKRLSIVISDNPQWRLDLVEKIGEDYFPIKYVNGKYLLEPIPLEFLDAEAPQPPSAEDLYTYEANY